MDRAGRMSISIKYTCAPHPQPCLIWDEQRMPKASISREMKNASFNSPDELVYLLTGHRYCRLILHTLCLSTFRYTLVVNWMDMQIWNATTKYHFVSSGCRVCTMHFASPLHRSASNFRQPSLGMAGQIRLRVESCQSKRDTKYMYICGVDCLCQPRIYVGIDVCLYILWIWRLCFMHIH